MSDTIVLTKLERLMLANQCRILSVLDPDESEHYDEVREALLYGYVLAYQEAFNQLYDGLSLEDCRMVSDILTVFDAIQRSWKALKDKAGIEKDDVGFPGFDGNNESAFMTYATFVREREHHFEAVMVNADGMNSHIPTLGRYRRMIEIWRGDFERSSKLSAEQIKRLLSFELDDPNEDEDDQPKGSRFDPPLRQG